MINDNGGISIRAVTPISKGNDKFWVKRKDDYSS